MASRKRQYRHRVRYEECNEEIDSDYKEVHSRLAHNGKKVKCYSVIESSDSSQSKINTFFVKSNMTTKNDDLQYDLNILGTESSGSKDSAVTVSFDEDLSEKNVKEPMSEDQTEPMTTFTDVDELSENVTPSSMNKVKMLHHLLVETRTGLPSSSTLISRSLSSPFIVSHKVSTYLSFYIIVISLVFYVHVHHRTESELRN